VTKGRPLQHTKALRDLRGVGLAGKPHPKPSLADRFGLWISTGHKVDGLWVGSTESKPQPALRRVEDALRLIKEHDSLHYGRVIQNLDRICIHLIPGALAHYQLSLNACVLDKRFVLSETTTLERIASAIVHEATHARLDKWGIDYVETARFRIEAICLRRELNFLTKLPNSEPFQQEIASTVEWYGSNSDYFSDVNSQERDDQGMVETARHVGIPEWFIRFILYVARRGRRSRAAAS
jgi:hypothetical protein